MEKLDELQLMNLLDKLEARIGSLCNRLSKTILTNELSVVGKHGQVRAKLGASGALRWPPLSKQSAEEPVINDVRLTMYDAMPKNKQAIRIQLSVSGSGIPALNLYGKGWSGLAFQIGAGDVVYRGARVALFPLREKGLHVDIRVWDLENGAASLSIVKPYTSKYASLRVSSTGDSDLSLHTSQIRKRMIRASAGG